MSGIILRRQNGEMSEVASIIRQDNQLLVAEMCFDKAGRPFAPTGKTHKWQVKEDFETAIAETYSGVDDPRLPDDIKSLPVGRREDFINAFNRNVYWYWKDEDEDYDENKPEHVNAVNYALALAYAAIKKADEQESAKPPQHAEGTEKVEEDTKGIQRVPLQEDGVGFVHAGEFEEDEVGGYKVPLQIIQAGWSLNGTYYTKEALQDIARLVKEKVVGYHNHGEHSRDDRDWNLVVEDAWVDGDTVQGNAHVFQYPDGKALKERIDYVKENDALHLFGVSIDGFAQVEEGTREGRKGRIVNRVIAMHSVDVVMAPAANGRWAKTTESVNENQTVPNIEEETVKMDLETLKKDHPELVEALIEEGRQEIREGELKEAQETVETKDGEIGTLQTSLTEANAKVETYELKQAQEAFDAKVKVYVTEELKDNPKLATERFVEDLIGLGEDKWDKIESLVEDRKNLEVGGPKGMGDETPVTEEKEEVSSKDRLASFKANAR